MTHTDEAVFAEQLKNLWSTRLIVDAYGFDETLICEDVYVDVPPREVELLPVYTAYLAEVAALSPAFRTLLIPQGRGTLVRTYRPTPKGRELQADYDTLTPYDQRVYAAVRAVRQFLAAQRRESRA